MLSVNERIENVDLGALAMAMFETDKVTGQINGQFRLTGRGNDMAEMQRNLERRHVVRVERRRMGGHRRLVRAAARARDVQDARNAPEPVLPARTRFSEVSATGVVTDGVLVNDDFRPTCRSCSSPGRGSVDIPAGSIDYSLTGRASSSSPELGEPRQPGRDRRPDQRDETAGGFQVCSRTRRRCRCRSAGARVASRKRSAFDCSIELLGGDEMRKPIEGAEEKKRKTRTSEDLFEIAS